MSNSVKYFVVITLILTPIFDLTCAAQNKWYKGNTHTHTTYSDGKLLPYAVKDLYVEAGYDFLFFTDEDRIIPIDTLSEESFLVFNGEEAIMDEQHISCLDIDSAVPPTNFTDVVEKSYLHGGFAVLNHPRRGTHEVWAPAITRVEQLFFMEIFNGKSEKDLHHDDQTTWDTVLTHGKLIYGVAADDFHEAKHLGKGWIMVRADTLQKDSILASILRGDFYSSTGPVINDILVTDTSIHIEAENATQIKFIGNNRTTLYTEASNVADYTITGEEGYIRVEVINGSSTAWTQPLYWNKEFEPFPNSANSVMSDKGRYSVYPNPASELISIVADNIAVKSNLTVISMSGQVVFNKDFSDKVTFDVSVLQPGLYTLIISDEQGVYAQKQLVI